MEPAKNKPISIALKDIRAGMYVLAEDVKFTKREGFSPNGWPRGKTAKSQADVTHNFGGATLQDLVDDGLERSGVRFRASARQANFYPSDTVAVAVTYRSGSKLDVSKLSPEVKAQILVASLPEGEDREAVLAEVLKALE